MKPCAKGWAAPHWAPEHGGTDWTTAKHYIWNRERIAAGAPGLSPMGISMVAYVIMKFGTPEQQQFFLPRILTGEIKAGEKIGEAALADAGALWPAAAIGVALASMGPASRIGPGSPSTSTSPSSPSSI